jgi:putative endonuclease
LSGEKRYYVYIMASRSLNFYTGVTNSIYRRTLQHKSGEVDGFTKKYNINRLVYYEVFEHIGNAIAREKQIKAWTRAKRIALIKTMNPAWQDLAEGWGGKTELQIPHFARDDKANESGASKGSQDEKHAMNEQAAAQSKADSKKTA